MASSSTAPWTPDEFRQKASSWSLEGDAKLLEFMQNISAELERRATKTTNSIHRLGLDVDWTNVALGNVTNQLAALQHSQFVENRVYEDDETIANESEVPVSDESEAKTKNDPIETLTKLLHKSMSVLERHYEKVSIDIEDSDEEDDSAKSVIYRPKDPCDARPLPYIIGSKEWIEKWHVGLCDSDEDYSEDEKEEEFSESSDSVSISASPASNAPTISESEFSAWGLQRNIADTYGKRQDGSYGSSEEDLSTAMKQSSKNNRSLPNNGVYSMPQNQDLTSNQFESANQYYVHKPKQKDRGLFDESSDESTDSELYNVKGKSERTVPIPVPTMRRDNLISNIISDVPPPDLDVVDKHEKPAVDLFCESDDEVVAPEPQKPENTTSKKEEAVASNIRKKTVNLFDDDDFDSFMQELNSKAQQKVGVAKKPTRNLFEESSEDEDTEAKETVETKDKNSRLGRPEASGAGDKPSTKMAEKISENIVRTPDTQPKLEKRLSDNLFAEKSHRIGGEEIKENKVDSSSVKRDRGLFDDDSAVKEDFTDIFRQPNTTKRTLITNLFDDEPPDDDFDSLFKPRGSVAQSTKEETPKKNPSTIVKKKLFDDSDSDDSLGIVTKDQDHLTEELGKKSIQVEQQPPVEKDIFEPDKVVTQPSFESKQKPLKLFDDESDDDSADLFHDIVSKPLHTRVEEKLENIPEGNNSGTSTQPEESRDEHDFEKKALPDIPLRSDEKPLMDSNEQEFIAGNLKLSSESRKDALKNIFSDDYIFEDEVSPEVEPKSNKYNAIENEREEENSHVPTLSTNDRTKGSLEPDEQITQGKDDTHDILEKTDNDLVFSKPKATPRNLLSSNIFSDVPPDDDIGNREKPIDVTFLEDDESDLKSHEGEISQNISDTNTGSSFANQISQDTPESQASAFNYNNISLFHDTPPDDDFEATPQDGKKLHSIFYDDFSETIVPSQMDAKPKSLSSYIFDEPPPDGTFSEVPWLAEDGSEGGKEEEIMPTTVESEMPKSTLSSSSSSFGKQGTVIGSRIFDEPPPDEFEPTSPAAITSNDKRLEKEPFKPAPPESESKISSIINQMQKEVTEVADDFVSKSNPSPKKLNSNLKINVAALLPGAKRPQLRTAEPERPRDNVLSNETLNSHSEVDVLDNSVKTIQNESDPKMLQSLNRTRAKIQVKRRPSTRRGRQENYRRSLIETDENPVVSSQDFASQEPPSAIFLEDEPPDDIFKPSLERAVEKQPPKLFFEENEVDDEFLVKPIPVVKAATQSPLNPKSAAPPQQAINKGGTDKPKTTLSIFDDESEDDDLFEESLKNSDKQTGKKTLPAKTAVTKPTERTKERSVVSKSIFGSDEDDDNDLFGGGLTAKPKIPVKSSASKHETSSNSLFDDNDDDDDDLFSGTSSKSKNVSQSTSRKIGTKKSVSQRSQAGATNKDFDDPLADLFKN
ncbi:WASH complex subunit 2 isoform X2 [Hermetia illucens]|uniref:WASH complex subunit 2 isoform X2 n=1 Tax=Hermetia illucens TaxID=343691 RepID=UPI0018CC3F3A|nr:WASH complex subunit 2 isoform X2 [Hermetia illucens]